MGLGLLTASPWTAVSSCQGPVGPDFWNQGACKPSCRNPGLPTVGLASPAEKSSQRLLAPTKVMQILERPLVHPAAQGPRPTPRLRRSWDRFWWPWPPCFTMFWTRAPCSCVRPFRAHALPLGLGVSLAPTPDWEGKLTTGGVGCSALLFCTPPPFSLNLFGPA